MTIKSERVFVLGGTGNVGSNTVKHLLSKNIPVTLYARQPEKVDALFSNNSLVQVIQGDYNDLSPLKEGLKGHTRLFLLTADLVKLVDHKKKIASWAYEQGIKQIVDVSSLLVSLPWRTTFIGSQHYYAEKAIFDLPNRGAFVTLRPGRFMSNLMDFDGLQGDYVVDTADADAIQGWVSPNDISAIASIVLSDPIEKHADVVYEIIGDVATSAQRAEYLSSVLGRNISYKKITIKERYDALMNLGHFGHALAYTLSSPLSSSDMDYGIISDGISILLKREPETLKKFIFDNKDALK